MMKKRVEVKLELGAGLDASDEELEELAQQLRGELLELDVDDVEFVEEGAAPKGTKGASSIDASGLLVTLATSGGVLTPLINALQSWLSRDERRSVVIEMDGDRLEVSNISSEEQQRLVEIYLKKHSG